MSLVIGNGSNEEFYTSMKEKERERERKRVVRVRETERT